MVAFFRPSKSTLVQFHITNEDISRSTTATAPGTPQETRRDTWPIPRQSRRPGTYSFDVAPTLVKTPWELERSKRYSRTPDRRPLKTRKFQQLPREIVVSILDQLKSLHCSGCTLNVTSYQNDLRALCTINRGWHRLAREHLYQEIWLPRNEEQNKSNIPFRKHGSRLKLLLRTLEESPGISNMVHHLRVTAKLADELEGEAWLTGPISKSSALRVLRDIIFKCRNLERLCGYAPMRLDSNIEIFDALSSCHRLKSHTWRLPPARAYPGCELRSSDLLRCHTSWHQLETLVIWQSIGEFLPNLHNSAVPNGLDGRYPGAMPIAGYEMWQRQQHGCGLGIGIITAVAQRLTSLKHLALGCLSPTDFHNGTLLTSPPLKSLRLEEVHGVTDQGIDQLVHSRLAMSLERLVLVGLELTSLQSLQSLFTNLTRLCSFSLVQDTSPEIPHPLSETNNYFSLASATMRYLHWDVLTRGTSTVIVANSIAAGKFPNLRTVKVPCDDDGAIQNLCRPIALEPITGQDMVRKIRDNVSFSFLWLAWSFCIRELKAPNLYGDLSFLLLLGWHFSIRELTMQRLRYLGHC